MVEVTSVSPQAMDGVLDRFRKICLADYLGEDVCLMVIDIQATYNILNDCSALPTTASSTVISNLFILKCGGVLRNLLCCISYYRQRGEKSSGPWTHCNP